MRRYIPILLLLLAQLTAMAETWVIDPGHGGIDVGCEGAQSYEKTINLKVAKELVRLIKQNMKGINIVMTRDKDVFVSLENRCRIANKAKADLFVSIHVNAMPDCYTLRGTETFYGPLGATQNSQLEAARSRNIRQSELLARLIQRSYARHGRPSDRGVKQERHWVLLHTMMPSVLTELGFLTTPDEEGYLNSKKGIATAAESIYEALAEYREANRNGKVQSTLTALRRMPFLYPSAGFGQKETKPKEEKPREAATTTPAPTPLHTEQTAAQAPPADTQNEPAAAATQKDEPKVAPGIDVKPGIDFRVQICSVTRAIKEGDPRLKGHRPIAVSFVNGCYKCYYGSTPDYEEALKMKQQVQQDFPGAFLVSFKDGVAISVAEAKEMYKGYLDAPKNN